MEYTIVSLTDRPDLAPLVPDWCWKPFAIRAAHTLEEMTALFLASHRGSEETFVLFDGDIPDCQCDGRRRL